MDRVEYDLRLSDPVRGLKADYENGRAAAIELHCKSCVGGSVAEVSRCSDQLCALWRFRPGSGQKSRKIGVVPTLDEYKKLINKKVSKEKREAGRKLGGNSWK